MMMYRPHVAQLRQFYSSHLGRRVRKALADAMARHWPHIHNDLVLGLGYANPLLRPYLMQEPAGALLLVPAMTAAQGAMVWPQHSSNRSVLVDEQMLPFADNVMNRIVMAHLFEHAPDTSALMAECWRVLTPGGRMLVLVPNRKGFWAGALHTPFSYGHPFSSGQLRDVLSAGQFTLVDHSYALHGLPFASPIGSRLWALCERTGRWLWPRMGGVIIMEVEKQIYARAKEPVRKAIRRPTYQLAGSKPAISKETI